MCVAIRNEHQRNPAIVDLLWNLFQKTFSPHMKQSQNLFLALNFCFWTALEHEFQPPQFEFTQCFYSPQTLKRFARLNLKISFERIIKQAVIRKRE